MPEFSACYFCGTALDAPLAEYPVIPDTLQPSAEQQRTVVLCGSCRRKLGAIVDAVVDAVDDPPSADSIQQGLAESAANGSSADASPSSVDSSAKPEGEGESADHRDSRSDDPAPAVDEAQQSGPGGPGARSRNEGEPVDDEDGGFEFAGGSDDESATADPVGGETESRTSETTEPEPVDDETQDSSVDHGSEGDVEDTDEDDEPQLTALEYNKVMRLLQNREFPVDHEEFKVVATNAYQIEAAEFDAIIEAAVKRDLIDIDGDQIVDA